MTAPPPAIHECAVAVDPRVVAEHGVKIEHLEEVTSGIQGTLKMILYTLIGLTGSTVTALAMMLLR